MASNVFRKDILLARQGDGDALNRVLTALQTRLRIAAAQRLGPPLRAKMATSDLLQSTYIDVVRSIKDFQGEDAPQLVAWITRIMENNLRDRARFYRRQRRNPEVVADEQPEAAGSVPTPSAEAMQVENLAAVVEALAELPEEQRQIMQLRVIEGRDYEEIAEQLGRSVGSLRMLLSRARAALAIRLERMLGDT